MRFPARTARARTGRALTAAVLMLGSAAFSPAATPITSAEGAPGVTITGAALQPGQIKHVWLIILENKSYDASFTGLNQNSYLWKTLPSQGVLLTNYYGTGHASMDNYISLVSGQAPSEDVQQDCSTKNTLINANSGIESAGGSLSANPNYGQLDSRGGPNAPLGANGCSYPTNVPTLFNQFNAAGVTWKDYAQSLGGEQNYVQDPNSPFQDTTVPGREDAACGGPGTADNNATTNPVDLNAPSGNVTSFTGVQNSVVNGTNYIDQYVAKHNPVPWFESLTGEVTPTGTTPALNQPSDGGTNCDAAHVVNLANPKTGLAADLLANTVPAFSWISPNNCSDAHDAVCKGNNLSGAFNADGSPNYATDTAYAYDPETIPPVNYTGGLYAADLFLEYYIPLIERSQAFQDGGLIDVTFDEGFPPFTYTGNSFNNADSYPPTAADKPNASAAIAADAAGQNVGGQDTSTEPTGPNSTLGTDANGNQLYPGPGNNSFIDRPPACTSTSPLTPANCVPGIVRGGSGNSPGARSDKDATGDPASSTIQDNAIVADDTGREVTGSNIPDSSFVGAVTDTGPQFPTESSGSATVGSFQLVDQSGSPVNPSGPVSGITLSAEGAPGALQPGQTPDPLYDATDPTPGGGDTGSVLIGPSIAPGTISNVKYNHYSWLRTMEDVFDVAEGNDTTPLSPGAGSVSGGLDGMGHLGYAAQAGLTDFGSDVFTQAGPDTAIPQSAPSASSDSVLVGTLDQAALTSEGDAIRVVTPDWSVTAVVNGPQVPGEGLPYQPPSTTCTWTVTLSNATASVPIDVAAFDAIDFRGTEYHPSLVPGQPEPPATLEPGETATFALRAGEPVGEGLMRWAPVGAHILATWDFVVEND
ncbi:MAG: phosphoesterase [Chloroflexi bacterium]|nr:phosphoesterase [Chloroflexota bacterium]